VFCRIDEEIFAGLYSEKASRPNTPVNVLAALDILKSGFGWSDRELHEQLCFNLQVCRHAVGMEDWGVFELRTLYNFRRRVREHAEETGEALFGEVSEQVTDAQLEAIETETHWQRVDSTQVMSNVAQQSRLELIISVVQKVWEELAKYLGEEEQEQWTEQLAPYVEERPHEISYEIPADETQEHLCQLGERLVALSEALREEVPETEARKLAEWSWRSSTARESRSAPRVCNPRTTRTRPIGGRVERSIPAAMRKLLHICYGVLKNGRPFDASLHPGT